MQNFKKYLQFTLEAFIPSDIDRYKRISNSTYQNAKGRKIN